MFAQVSIFILTQVHKLYMYLLKKEDQYFKKKKKFNKPNKGKTRMVL